MWAFKLHDVNDSHRFFFASTAAIMYFGADDAMMFRLLAISCLSIFGRLNRSVYPAGAQLIVS